jgi:hypothetical protein
VSLGVTWIFTTDYGGKGLSWGIRSPPMHILYIYRRRERERERERRGGRVIAVWCPGVTQYVFLFHFTPLLVV